MLYFQDYIMAAPVNAQECLISILEFIEHEFPDAEQGIYHGLPTFFLGKRDIINIGAYKDHIGLHIGYTLVGYFKEKYPTGSYTKSTIQFPYTELFPFGLLKEVCSQIGQTEKTP